MTAPCRRREEGGGRPPSAITGRAAAAAPWGCAAAPSARWPGWAWTPRRPAPSPSGCMRRRRGRRGRPSGPRAAAAAAARAPTPRTPMATVTRRREAVTIETGCCTWAPGPRWPTRCPSTSHRGGSARTAVSAGSPEPSPRPPLPRWVPGPGGAAGTLHPARGGLGRGGGCPWLVPSLKEGPPPPPPPAGLASASRSREEGAVEGGGFLGGRGVLALGCEAVDVVPLPRTPRPG